MKLIGRGGVHFVQVAIRIVVVAVVVTIDVLRIIVIGGGTSAGAPSRTSPRRCRGRRGQGFGINLSRNGSILLVVVVVVVITAPCRGGRGRTSTGGAATTATIHNPLIFFGGTISKLIELQGRGWDLIVRCGLEPGLVIRLFECHKIILKVLKFQGIEFGRYGSSDTGSEVGIGIKISPGIVRST